MILAASLALDAFRAALSYRVQSCQSGDAIG